MARYNLIQMNSLSLLRQLMLIKKALNAQSELIPLNTLEMKPLIEAEKEIYGEADYKDKIENYALLLKAFMAFKKKFLESSLAIKQIPSATNQLNFEKASKQYFTALTIMQSYQVNLATALIQKTEVIDFTPKKQYLEQQIRALNKDVAEFKREALSVATTLVDRQLPINGAMTLKEGIAAIHDQYNRAYEQYGNGFWGWIKKIFQRSDRAQEIAFLEQISQSAGDDDKIRAQALALIHNKIVASEYFGKGSQLGKLLGTLLQNTSPDIKDSHQDITTFIYKTPGLIENIPNSLKQYFEENQNSYHHEGINVMSL